MKDFPGPVTVAEVAQSIGAGLARAALAGKVNGRLVDTSYRIESDAELAIVTEKNPGGRGDPAPFDRAPARARGEGAVPRGAGDDRTGDRERLLLRLRLQAPLHARGPGGDREADGRDSPRRILQLPEKPCPATRRSSSSATLGEKYKAEIIRSIPSNEPISLYSQGDFIDLCRGPHVPSTGKLKVFKLMRVAGAYWRGDSKNEMLQRIYGTAWGTKEAQDAYLKMLEEAEKRDHRRLATQLDLFHMEEDAPGHGVLAPQGLDPLAAGGAVHAQGLPGQRLPGGARADGAAAQPVGEDRPLGELPREHVHDRIGKARLRGEADELPRAISSSTTRA